MERIPYKKVIFSVLIDCKKAFDCINRMHWFRKLLKYGSDNKVQYKHFLTIIAHQDGKSQELIQKNLMHWM